MEGANGANSLKGANGANAAVSNVPYPIQFAVSNVPEPIGFRLRTHPHVDWFLRFVGKLFKIKKQKTV
jgi:hypothetical protein